MTRRRKRYSDVIHVKPTNGKPRINADWKSRHISRKDSANRDLRNAGLAFAILSAWLVVKNEGRHWQIWFPKGRVKLCEWWPASAKLVVDQQWKQGVHVHRWQDVFRVVRQLRKDAAT